MIPFIVNGEPTFNKDEYVFIPNVRKFIFEGNDDIKAYVIGDTIKKFSISGELTEDEKSHGNWLCN